MVLYLSLRAVARAIQTMSRPGPKSTSENRRVRALLSSLCALCCVLPLSWAGRPVRVYEVDVDGQSGAAVQDGNAAAGGSGVLFASWLPMRYPLTETIALQRSGHSAATTFAVRGPPVKTADDCLLYF